MPQYLLAALNSLLCIGIIGSLTLNLFNTSPFRSAIKLICSLLVLLSLINALSPVMKRIMDIVIENPEKEEGIQGEQSSKLLNLESARYIAKYTEDMISNKFSVSKESFSVCVTLSDETDGNLFIKNITLEFYTDVGEVANQISKFVSDTLYCECILLIDDIGERDD